MLSKEVRDLIFKILKMNGLRGAGLCLRFVSANVIVSNV